MANELGVPIYTQLTYNAVRSTGDPQTDVVGGLKDEDPLGRCWVDLDPTLGRRTFKFVTVKATSLAVANGDVLVWTDKYGLVVSTKQADAVRTMLSGVGQAAISISKNGWIQTDGYHAAVKTKNDNFALGDIAVIDATDQQATRVAPGTASPYPEVGTVVVASNAQATAQMQLHVGKSAPSF